jgi:hypothetical protein
MARKLTVSSRARQHEDRAGDPLDGLVNLFDLGIVLAVAFLLAALSSINVSPSDLRDQTQQRDPREVTVKPGEKAEETKVQSDDEVVGRGAPIGTVYQLEDGRQILVKPGGTPPTTTSTQPGG